MLYGDFNASLSSVYRPPGREPNVLVSEGLPDRAAVRAASSAGPTDVRATKINTLS